MKEQKQTILIVDDEASYGNMLKAALEMHGFIVRYEACPTNTIKTCLEVNPDVVLLDLNMPVEDGGDVASELRSHPTLRLIPIVFLSSLFDQQDAVKRNEYGEIFLSKSISIAKLVATIRTLQPLSWRMLDCNLTP